MSIIDPRTADDIRAYLAERAAFERRGDKGGVAAVDVELKRLGYTRAEAKKSAPVERAVKSKPETRG